MSRGYRYPAVDPLLRAEERARFGGITQGVSRTHKLLNLIGVVLPFLAFVAAIVLLWNTWVDWSDLAVLRSCTCSPATA